MNNVILDDVLKYEQPTKYIVESDYYNDANETPVLTAGKSFILGYTDETKNIYENFPVIIFDDFTTATKFVDFPFKVKSSAMKILKNDATKTDIKFLFYLMQTIKINSEQHQRYWISKYSKIEIPLPPLSVQKAIAEKLDKADALRIKDKELLAQYDELAQAIFIDMFGDPVRNEKGWEIQSFGKVTKSLNNKRIPLKSSDRDKLEQIYPYYGASGIIDLVDNYLFNGDNLLIGEDGANLLSRSTPIAFIASGKYWVNNHAHVLAYAGKCNLVFLNYFINSIDLAPYITGSAQPKLNKANLDSIPVPVPLLELQTQFAEKIKNIEAQKAIVKQQAQQSEDLFQALLQESFNFNKTQHEKPQTALSGA